MHMCILNIAYIELHGKAIIGKTKDLWTPRKLDILLKESKFRDTIIKYLGSLSVLIVFISYVKADCFRSKATGFGWFSSMDTWKGQSTAFERIAWLNIHGVPLHLSGNETFDSVGRCFGKKEVVSIVEEGMPFRVWVKEKRGEWFPDSIENQDKLPEEDDVSVPDINISINGTDMDGDTPMKGNSGNVGNGEQEKVETMFFRDIGAGGGLRRRLSIGSLTVF
ncbi:hypothetical protein Hanom_Chr16g01431001 [Helianthus anomalus]